MKNKAAQQLGRKGGKAKTEAKQQAARENGAKGGRRRRWIPDGDHWALRALVPQEDGTVDIGRISIQFKGGAILGLYGEPVTIQDAEKTRGWGDLDGDDMVRIEGCVTHRRWLEELHAAHS